jgi:hypothetical protein
LVRGRKTADPSASLGMTKREGRMTRGVRLPKETAVARREGDCQRTGWLSKDRFLW